MLIRGLALMDCVIGMYTRPFVDFSKDQYINCTNNLRVRLFGVRMTFCMQNQRFILTIVHTRLATKRGDYLLHDTSLTIVPLHIHLTDILTPPLPLASCQGPSRRPSPPLLDSFLQVFRRALLGRERKSSTQHRHSLSL